ncbi:MAG: nucleotidyl transferase AbiEii/AbiGii toxin family protein [Patescibacteria group bacterium]
MITITPQDAVHKAWLYRVLVAIVDNPLLSVFYFKGGTCAAMSGYLDRFSVDLDFDYVGQTEDLPKVRRALKKVFVDLGLEIKDESAKVPQFFLKYPTKDPASRNTLKIDITFPAPKANVYEPTKLTDIERIVICQNIETMFANKLVAVIDRYERNRSLAGRDIYDIHHFFLNGYTYNGAVITERTGLELREFFNKLRLFIEEHITETVLDQDLNPLIPYERFRQLRKTLKIETMMFINEEIKRLG